MDNFNLQGYIASGKLHANSKTLTEAKKQGYDDREDESLGARKGAEKDKKQSMKDRRDDSYGKFGKRDAEKKGKNKINKEGVVKESETTSDSISKTISMVTNFSTAAKAMLDLAVKMQEIKKMDFMKNSKFKVVINNLKDLAGDKEEVPVNENLAITQKMLEKAMEKDPKFEEKVYKAVEDAKRGKTNDLRDITNYLSSLKIDEEVSDGEVSDEEIKNIEDTLKKINEDARTDAEEEGYKDGMKDEKADMKKMKVSELKAKIKEEILAELSLSEADEEVDVDIDVEDEVEVDAEADDIEIERKGTTAKVEVGLSPEEEIVQDSLKAAMDAAQALGSDKLADQIGNTITFFTRQFVVGDRTD